MKKGLILFSLFLSCTFVLCACDNNNGGSAKAVDFENIFISRNYCPAESYVIEATRTEYGVHLSRYVTYGDYDDPEISITYEVDGDENLYKQIAEKAGSCNITSWNGFHESAKNVLDGDSFSFEAELADGSTITASGSNAYPKNFFVLEEYLSDLLEGEMIESTEVSTKYFTMTVPERWVNQVFISYDPNYFVFELPVGEDEYSYLFRMDVDYYESVEVDDQTIYVGKLVSEDEELYLSVYIYDYGRASDDKLTEEQKEIYENLEEDLIESLKTIEGTNQYTINIQ